MSGEYVTIYEEYKHKFVQIPKVFFTSDKYTGLSNNAKIAWALLRERSSVSRKNKWFDKENGRVYFIYRNQDLMRLLNFGSEHTVIRLKKELASHGLIEEVRLGRNKPNKLYLKYPIVEDEDIKKIDEFENYEEPQSPSEDVGESLDRTGTAKNAAPKSAVPELQKVQSSYTKYSYTKLKRLDTSDTEDTETDDFSVSAFTNSLTEEERDKQKQKYMEDAFYANYNHVPERIAHMLSVFSTTPEQANEYYKIILQAKKNVENKLGQVIFLEDHRDLEQGVINAFSRAVRKVEKDRNIENETGYIYQSIYGYLTNEIHNRIRKSAATNNDNSNIVFFDWLEI